MRFRYKPAAVSMEPRFGVLWLYVHANNFALLLHVHEATTYNKRFTEGGGDFRCQTIVSMRPMKFVIQSQIFSFILLMERAGGSLS